MKKLIYITLTLFVLGLFVATFAYINQDKLIDRVIERQSRGVKFKYELLNDTEGITVITVGTGSPLPSERVQTCNAVLVNGHFFVFDVGEGGARKMEDLRLPITEVEAVFISHWHADHFIDLPNLINRSWLLGRSGPMEVFGPEGVDSVMNCLSMIMNNENKYRIAHHGTDLMNADLANGIPKKIEVEGTEIKTLYQKDGIIISAFLVDHEPVSPSLGFKIEYNNCSVVLSGDTKKSENVIRYSNRADLLIHEAMQMNFIERASKLQRELGNDRNAKILSDIMDYHSSPEDAAEVAQAAGVRKLILNHLAPAPENPISRRFYLRGLDKIFKGPILLAEDGDVFFVKNNNSNNEQN